MTNTLHFDHCPACGSACVGTKDSRSTPRGRRRRKFCGDCRHRWTTLEVPALVLQDLEIILAGAQQLSAALERFTPATAALSALALAASEDGVEQDECVDAQAEVS